MKSFVAVLFCLVLFAPVVFVGCDRERAEPSNLVNAPLEAPHAVFSYTGNLTTPTSILFHNSSVNADRTTGLSATEEPLPTRIQSSDSARMATIPSY